MAGGSAPRGEGSGEVGEQQGQGCKQPLRHLGSLAFVPREIGGAEPT